MCRYLMRILNGLLNLMSKGPFADILERIGMRSRDPKLLQHVGDPNRLGEAGHDRKASACIRLWSPSTRLACITGRGRAECL